MKDKIINDIKEITTSLNITVGNDLVYLPEFQKSFTDLFIKKAYTEKEITYCSLFKDSLLRYASTWAAKEAAYKAFKQVDQSIFGWRNIEIIRDKIAGRPSIVIHSSAIVYKTSLTISHDGDYVWAIAIVH